LPRIFKQRLKKNCDGASRPGKRKESQISHEKESSEATSVKSAEPSIAQLSGSNRQKSQAVVLRILPAVIVACVVFFLIIIIAVPHKPTTQAPRHAMEYRAEGLPFQERLYPQDKVSLPLEDDFIAITLESIDEKANFLHSFWKFFRRSQ